eukprot:TRINITY_DN22364_c0_g1_i1.p1 TRINITY_DN22364_c0_g1~~TRINITY_DN22364_c0_g1_i1.p1  ORF type:complete len:100 (+),score=21.13 TRINITY_DN22364_c0_g1_i1:193-492(+)
MLPVLGLFGLIIILDFYWVILVCLPECCRGFGPIRLILLLHAHVVVAQVPIVYNIVLLPPDTLAHILCCLLYTSDAADDLLCVDLGGRRIIKKKKNNGT